MRVYNRSFDNDSKEMLAFLVDDYIDRQDHYVWSATRLGWHVSNPAKMKDNVHLWFNGIDDLIGFAISENGNADFFAMARRGHEFLYGEIIEWVKANWSDKKGELRTDVDENQQILMRALETSGFKKGGANAVTRQYDLSAMNLSAPVLSGGTVIKDMAACPNEYGIRLLRNNAYSGRNEVTEEDLARQIEGNDCIHYFPHLNVYAENRDGFVVSGCVGLPDYKSNHAEIEIVCTHSEHRRKGYAQAVIIECMRKLRDEGIKHAYITGYSEEAIGLYGKFEFAKSRNWYGFSM